MRTVRSGFASAALAMLFISPAQGQTASTQANAAAVAHPALWPVAHSPAAITDPATERMITRMIQKMTLEQKVGQVIQADISTITPADLKTYPLGSILAGGNSGPYGNERGTAADWHKLIEEFRTVSAAPRKTGIGVPIIFGLDAVHGHSNLPNATIFPHNVGLGATHDPDLVERIGRATAEEMSGSGIEWTFAPTLTVPQDVRWGRSYEGYSSDPAIVASYAGRMVKGLQGILEPGKPLNSTEVAASAKHFLADGGTFEGKDQGDARISEADLIKIHAAGYPPAIDAGALTIMISFSSWNGVKHHGNKSLITDVLKGRMGFEGLTVGDWNGYGQIDGCTVTDCSKAINAGLDLYMAPDNWKGLFASLLAEAKSGEVPMSRLDDAVRRILRVKAKLGLIGPTKVQRFDPSRIGTPAHLALAREAVAKSLVLLKNEGSVLPIRPGAKVLVTGPGADNMAMQNGGWTISWQGTDVTHADFTNGQTVYEAIAAAVDEAGGKATLSADGSFTDKPDVVIAVYGETPYAEFQGDRSALIATPVDPQRVANLKAYKANGIPVVSVFLSGRALFTSPEINASDAFVAAWLPGTQANGIADVLVAREDGKTARDFTGRLSYAWPADARSPITQPLFPLGYGLSYAKPGTVPTLSEDAKVDVTALSDPNALYDRGNPGGAFQLHVSDAGGDRGVTSVPLASMGGNVKVTGVDLGAQEDGRRFAFAGPGTISIIGQPSDYSRQLNNSFAIRMDLKVDAVESPTTIEFGTAKLDATAMLKALPTHRLTTLKIPLRCFANAGAKVNAVDRPFGLSAAAGSDITIKTLRIEAVGEDLACPSK